MEFDQARLKKEINATCQICHKESTIQRVIVTIQRDGTKNAMGHPTTTLDTAYPVCTPCAKSPPWRVARLDNASQPQQAGS